FAIVRGPRAGDALLADWKPIGPAHIPAHGHCSLFSYELSIDGRRIIVDSGVEEYEPGPWRTYWRSTRAHNTAAVDGGEQSDIWGAFRVARRARRLGFAVACGAGMKVLAGARDGCDLAAGMRHERFIVGTDEARWYVLDRITGNGAHRVSSFVHFHPDVACDVRDGRVLWRAGAVAGALAFDAVEASVRLECGSENPPQGWYAESFGSRRPAPVAVLERTGPLPLTLGYAIDATGRAVAPWSWHYERTAATTGTLTIEDGRTHRWVLDWSGE
ncbi:MAG: heparinase II/III-family protein, partial [Acidobacteriota bacterium]|nr:heparinase II/III-family protein [Acidobacteriota bacterium]